MNSATSTWSVCSDLGTVSSNQTERRAQQGVINVFLSEANDWSNDVCLADVSI